jgi:hypothetical protein
MRGAPIVDRCGDHQRELPEHEPIAGAGFTVRARSKALRMWRPCNVFALWNAEDHVDVFGRITVFGPDRRDEGVQLGLVPVDFRRSTITVTSPSSRRTCRCLALGAAGGGALAVPGARWRR